MKILIATGLYPPDIGGPATYTVFLEKHAPRFGFELVVVPFGNVRRYPPVIRHLLYLVTLIRKSRGCDVIYALDTVSVGVPALIAHFVTRIPLMLRVPGDYAWEQGQQRYGVTETLDEYLTHPRQPLPVRFMAWLQYQVARHAKHIVVPSDYMKGVVTGWGIDPEKITRIYSILKTIDVQGFAKERNNEVFTVTTAARLVPWKGVARLIDAVVGLHRGGMPVKLVVIGDGVCRRELEARTASLEANAFVRFTGALPRTELGRELTASDVFVLNTSYEGLSHQLIEVMSLGLPIITTPVGGNIELITHEETGLMVPFNDTEALQDTLYRLYSDRVLGATLATNARKSVNKFHEDIIVEEFVRLMRSLWKS